MNPNCNLCAFEPSYCGQTDATCTTYQPNWKKTDAAIQRENKHHNQIIIKTPKQRKQPKQDNLWILKLIIVIVGTIIILKTALG